MKYIKQFENRMGQRWMIPLKTPDFHICLRKVGMNQDQIEKFTHLHNIKIFQKDSVVDPEHIMLEKYPEGGFTWSQIDNWFNKVGEDTWRFKWIGELKVTPEEIEKWYDDIEMEKNTKKYNI